MDEAFGTEQLEGSVEVHIVRIDPEANVSKTQAHTAQV